MSFIATVYKIIRIPGNFYTSSKLNELIIAIVVPFIVCIPLIFIDIHPDDINEYLNTLLTMASIITSFEVAVITILFTSQSKNIEIAKRKSTTNRTDLEGFGISYYQLILIRNFYLTFVLIALIFIGLIFKLLLNMIPPVVQKILLGFELFAFVHAIVVLIFVLIHMYHLLWEEKLTKE
jgi:hypothetical protein